MAREMDDIQGSKKPRWTDTVREFKFTPKMWHKVRFFGLTYSDFRHSVSTNKGKVYYEYCHAYDVDNDTFLSDREERCECCRMKLPGSMRYYMNVIDMDKFEDGIEAPIYLMELPKTLFEKLQGLKPLNKGVAIHNAQKGCVVNVSKDPDADPGSMYNVSLDASGRGPLPEKLINATCNWDKNGTPLKGKDGMPPAFVYQRQVSSRDAMRQSLERNGHYGSSKGDDGDDMPVRRRSDDEDGAARAMSEEATPARVRGLSEAPTSRRRMDDEDEAPARQRMPEKAKVVHEEPEEDDEPAPVVTKKRVVVDDDEEEEPAPALKRTSKLEVPEGVPDDCPTQFGEYAKAHPCYTKCRVRKQCVDASVNKAKSAKTEDDAA